jgi:hypothetical protein
MVVLSSASDSFFPVSRADSHEKKLIMLFCGSCLPGCGAGGEVGERGLVQGGFENFARPRIFADPAQF